MPDDALTVSAIFAAIAGLVSALVGLVLVARNLRSKSRRAALDEADELEQELATCRAALLVCGRRTFTLEAELSAHGINSP